MLFLASNSPRRKQILRSIGVDFLSISPEVDETVMAGELPGAYTCRIATSKALSACQMHGANWTNEDLILAADTAVIDPDWHDVDGISTGQILGKPTGEEQAEAMLLRLRGRTHEVCSTIVVLEPTVGVIHHATEFSTVKMRKYSPVELKAYISSRDPFDKAGGYAIQNSTFKPVDKVIGCYPNVVGLPVCLLKRMLEEYSLSINIPKFESCKKSEEPCWIYYRVVAEVENGYSSSC